MDHNPPQPGALAGNAGSVIKKLRPSNSWDTTKELGFLLIMIFISGFFWVLGLIPIVNIFSDTLYWVIWAFIYAIRYGKGLMINPRRAVLSAFIALICYVLGLIPVVDIIPWDIIGTVILILIGRV